MPHGYPLASLVAGASAYVDLSMLMPGWLAGVATVHIVCAVVFMGLLKQEMQ